jgi:hypothetical protein
MVGEVGGAARARSGRVMRGRRERIVGGSDKVMAVMLRELWSLKCVKRV